jgi:predicted nucleic acid-binding protein
MSRVYWDSMIFIYWLEDHRVYAPQVQALYNKMSARGDSLCTGLFTLGEILVGPHKRGDHELVEAIGNYLKGPEVELLPFTVRTAEKYAEIRAKNAVSASDAIHLASAATEGIDLFVTNDRALRKLVIPGIHFIAGLDGNIL